MSVAELKEKLIHQKELSNDISLLEDIERIINIESSDTEIFQLSEPQIAAIEEGRENVKNNATITNVKANQEIEEWLKK